jgi:hypothetical protein
MSFFKNIFTGRTSAPQRPAPAKDDAVNRAEASNALDHPKPAESDEEEYGIFTFRPQPDTETGVVDIIALHGLNRHCKQTWTIEGQTWLKDDEFLASRLPCARIMSYGYNS